MYQTILLSIILAGTATAAPKALPAPDVGPIMYCPPIVTSYTAKAAPHFFDPSVHNVPAGVCISTNELCNIETDATVSLSNAITERASLTEYYTRPEIGSIAFSLSVSQTFTHGKFYPLRRRTCPPGDYYCGITSAASFQVVSGVKTKEGTSIRWYLCIAPTSANKTLVAGMVMC